ncbi:MAG TPA: PadR family transcriptional regulator [Steroidobacteraceae bacterium]|jgi:PadR family transcriptional regulator PadR
MARPHSSLGAGISELLILKLLARQEMYGYELAKSVQASTGRAITLGEGVLYPLLHALELHGLLRSRRDTVASRPRIYYRATAKGQKRLAQLIGQWQRTREALDAALGDQAYAQ